MSMRVHIDFETRSELDVSDVGSVVYAAHPSTDILCIGYAVDDGPVEIRGFETFHSGIYSHLRFQLSELEELAAMPDCIFIAHNSFFEQNIWKSIMVKRYDFPKIPIERWRCTAAKAAFFALPRKLEKASIALDLPIKKDMDGNRTMLKLARPRRPSISNPDRFWEPNKVPAEFEKLYDYNRTDVVVERLLDNSLRDLSPLEQEIWFMDQRMNHHGIQLDLPAISRAVEFMEICTERLLTEFKEVTNGAVEKPSQRNRFIEWIESFNILIPDLQAATVDRLLAQHKSEDPILSKKLPDPIFKALSIRRQLSRTSTRKYQAMLNRVSPDGRLRDILLYYGARTGRWAGRGVQPQNFVRPKGDVYKTIDDLMNYEYDIFDMLYPVMDAIAEVIRGMIIAGKGMVLYVADFAAIEARVLAWLAGETALLESFHKNECAYCLLASTIYDRPITKANESERQVGKVGILAMGYQGGISAYAKMAGGYKLDMEPVFSIIWPTTTPEEREKATKSYQAYRHQSEDPISEKAGLAADIIKQRYRLANPAINKYWYIIENAAIEAVKTDKPVHVGKLIFFTHGKGDFRFLHVKLPSGRPLAYHKPRLRETKTPWGKMKYQLTYMGEDPDTHQYIWLSTYGGKLVENIVQAVARDLMAEAFLRIEKAGYIPALQVHDEAIAEVPKDFGNVEEYEALMAELPPWAEGLPVKAEGWKGPRYKK